MAPGFSRVPRRRSRAPSRFGLPLLVAVLLSGGLLPLLAAASMGPTSPGGATHLDRGGTGGVAGPATAGASGPLGARVPQVLSTLDLAANRSYAGAMAPGVQSQPQTEVLDPANGNLYVRGYLGNDISVVDARTHADIADISVPYSQMLYVVVPSIAVVPSDDVLYAANVNAGNVSIISGTSQAVTGSIGTGGSPYGIAYDPVNGDLYVTNYGGNNVTVISAASNRTVANVSVGSHPAALAYDPVNRNVYIANFGSANVSVINTTTNTVVGTDRVGASPSAVVIDTIDDYVDVVNSASANVSVINATTDAVTSVAVGQVPQAAAFNPLLDRLYVANAASDTLSVVNQTSRTVLATVGIGHGAGADSVAFYAANHTVYVANAGSDNVTVVDTGADRSVANLSTGSVSPSALVPVELTGEVFVPNVEKPPMLVESNVTVIRLADNRADASIPLQVYPTGVAYNPQDGSVEVANSGGNATYWLNTSSGLVGGVAPVGPAPTVASSPLVYDSSNHDFYEVSTGADDVMVLSSAHALLKTIPVGLDPVAIAFDSASGNLFVAQDIDGNVSVINGTSNTVVGSLPVKLYDNVRAVGVDPVTDRVFVADWTTSNVSVWNGTSLAYLRNTTVGLDPQSIVYDSRNQTVWVGNYGSGTVSVLAGASGAGVGSFPLSETGVLVYDAAQDTVYNAEPFTSLIDAVNATTYLALTGSPIHTGLLTYLSGLALDPSNGFLYASSESGGTLSILGHRTSYTVTFQESGLPSGTPWSVTVDTTTNTSRTATLSFVVGNGSHPYTVHPVAGYLSTPVVGYAVVTGRNVTLGVTFTSTAAPPSYPAFFNETGLPGGTTWDVTLNGTLGSASSASIEFNVSNGTYPYLVGVVRGYTASPSSGSVPVTGGPATVSIAFTANSTPENLSVSLAVAPSTVHPDAATNLTATVRGGTAPYSYEYGGLPLGCLTSNRSVLPCRPTAAGSYNVTVLVTDAHGKTATAAAHLEVLPAGSSPPATSGASSGLPLWVWTAIVLLVVLLAVFLLAFLRRRKRDASGGPPGSAPPSANEPVVTYGSSEGPPGNPPSP